MANNEIFVPDLLEPIKVNNFFTKILLFYYEIQIKQITSGRSFNKNLVYFM